MSDLQQLRIRLNALLSAYVREEELFKDRPMIREEVIAELHAIKATLDAAKPLEPMRRNTHALGDEPGALLSPDT